MRRTMNTDFTKPAEETARPVRRKKRRNNLRLLLRVMLVVVLLLCLYALMVNWKDIAPDRFVSWVQDVVSGTTGGSWPVDLSSETAQDMQEVGGNMVLLTDGATVYYNSSGGESLRRTYAYAKPLMRTADRYVLLMETGGKRFRLESRDEVVFEPEEGLSNNIYTGAVSVKGDVALVTDSSQSHVSEVIVFSRKGNERYQWYSSEWLVMDASFSKDGNSLAVVGCRTQGGAMQSAVLVFDLRGREEAPVQYVSDNVLFTGVQYMSGGTVIAIGDSQARFVNPTGSLDVTVAHEEEELIGYTFSTGDVMLVTRAYGSQDGGKAAVYSSTGDLRAEVTFAGEFRDAASSNKNFLLLTDAFVHEVKYSGITGQAEVAADSLMTGAIDGKPLVLGLTSLSEVSFVKPTE